MAKKISQLTQATEVKSDDVTVIVQDGETKKLPLNMMVTKQDIENKKVAGLAKLDEIEATYENDTYTPTITVKNKSSVKTGEGDEVDYSANVMDGHVKSAILKGQTLVNLIKGGDVKKEITYSGGTEARYYFNKSMLKANVDYLLIYEVIDFSGDDSNISFNENNGYGITQSYFNKNGIHKTKVNFSDVGAIKDFIIFYKITGLSLGGFVNNVMLVEYQEGMENWNIPYFEGMQSVKLPVLTTTGKNLNPTNIEPLGLYDSTGANNNNLSQCRTDDFINVTPNQVLTVSSDQQINRVFGYDTDGNFLGLGVGNIVKHGYTEKKHTFTVPNNCHKIKITSFVNTNTYFQLEEGTIATSYEPYKSNILTVNEEVELRGIGDVRDELDLLTGELTQRIGEVVLDGSENWNINYQGNSDLITFSLNQFPTNIAEHSFNNCKNFLISDSLPIVTDYQNNKGILSHRIGGNHWVVITVNRSDLISEDVVGFKHFLSTNPVTIQYQLAQESVKTVDLMPSGTHPSTTPYCWKNGHIQLSSSGLLPSLEYSVVTSRAGQINQNATMIVKNDKRIFDLEILLAGGLVNTTYQALTLQNQVETGLSKVSLNSETEPDYLLYHMIMKLIEEKAYKLDDLTEKVSVFYLYEKLSDEQFETIYSALYPFVEDEIVEEPVVEELPEVVEDEVIM